MCTHQAHDDVHTTGTKIAFFVWCAFCVPHVCRYFCNPCLSKIRKFWTISCRMSAVDRKLDICTHLQWWNWGVREMSIHRSVKFETTKSECEIWIICAKAYCFQVFGCEATIFKWYRIKPKFLIFWNSFQVKFSSSVALWLIFWIWVAFIHTFFFVLVLVNNIIEREIYHIVT